MLFLYIIIYAILMYSLVLILLFPHGFLHILLRYTLVPVWGKVGVAISLVTSESFSFVHLNDAQWEGSDRRT